MLFMIFMIPKDGHKAPAEYVIDEKMKADMAGMGRFNDSLRAAGVLRDVHGLKPPAAGARLAFSGGAPAVRHGPLPETTEAVCGYWLLELNSQEEAISWMKKCPALPGDVIEVRQIEG